MKIFFLLALFSAALAGENIVNLADGNPTLLLNLFNEFQHNFEQQYTLSERRMRLSLFRKFVAKAAERNAEEPDVEYGLTIFADRTEAETANMLGLNASMPASVPQSTVSDSLPPLGFADYKSLYGAVKNQGHTQACWAFAATGVLEGWTSMTNGHYTSLSEQETADCTTGRSTIEYGGFHWKALDDTQTRDHLTTEANLPFTFRDGRCNTKFPNALPFKITSVNEITTDKQLANALESGPVAAGMKYGGMVVAYKSGIYKNNDCNSLPVTHAVTIVGYAADYWEIRNSYGAKGWGDGGYGKFTRSINNMCNLSDYSFSISIEKRAEQEKEQ